MNVRIQSINFTLKQELENFIQEKTEKLYRLYDKTLSCEVVLKVEKSETGDNKLCDIRMIIPGNDLLAGGRSATFEEATMQAIEALERQIHRKKTRTLQADNKRDELK
jgi:putative sigma-54 modulation protein